VGIEPVTYKYPYTVFMTSVSFLLEES